MSEDNPELKLAPKDDQSVVDCIIRYVALLNEYEDMSEEIEHFRQKWPKRYLEICQLHLCTLFEDSTDLMQLYQNPSDYKSNANEVNIHSSTNSSEKMHGHFRQDAKVTSLKSKHFSPNWRSKSWNRLRSVAQSVSQNRTGSLPKSSPTKETAILTTNLMKNLLTMIDVMDSEESLQTEGVFRKPGLVHRQRRIRHRLLMNRPIRKESLRKLSTTGSPEANSSRFTVHDFASALKGILMNLEEPILTGRLIPIFLQAAELTDKVLTNSNSNQEADKLFEAEKKLAFAKQLKALRILCLLLPPSHNALVRRLLVLLKHTVEYGSKNRMSSQSLGTIFVPLLFAPDKANSKDLSSNWPSLSRLAAVMIDEGDESVCAVPKTFAQDLRQNRELIERVTKENNGKLSDSSDLSTRRCPSVDSGIGSIDAVLPPLVTSIRYTDTLQREHSNSSTGSDEVTMLALAELSASVYSLPDFHPQKKRLMKQLNGGVTPHVGKPANQQPKNWKTSFLCSKSECNSFQRGTFGTSTDTWSAVRSSLRRKLAPRGVVDTFNQKISEKTSLRYSDEKSRTCLNGSLQEDKIVKRESREEKENQVQQQHSETASLIFDGSVPPVNIENSLDEHEPPCTTNSPPTDRLFCCSLVDVITSPFRRRPDHFMPTYDSSLEGMRETPQLCYSPAIFLQELARRRLFDQSKQPDVEEPCRVEVSDHMSIGSISTENTTRLKRSMDNVYTFQRTASQPDLFQFGFKKMSNVATGSSENHRKFVERTVD